MSGGYEDADWEVIEEGPEGRRMASGYAGEDVPARREASQHRGAGATGSAAMRGADVRPPDIATS